MKRQTNIKHLQQSLLKWQESHRDINSLRKAYQEKIPDWVAKSMEFEREQVDINRLKELYSTRRRSIRLRGFDYSQGGAYFVTICSYRKELIFADAIVASIINKQWQNLPKKFSCIRTDEFVIMPNHIHFILWIENVGATLAVAQHNEMANKRAGASPAPTLGNIVGAFKSMVSTDYLKWINQNHAERSAMLWQRNYYEHVIRNEGALNRIREYIINNPLNWEADIENPLNLTKEKATDYYDRIF